MIDDNSDGPMEAIKPVITGEERDQSRLVTWKRRLKWKTSDPEAENTRGAENDEVQHHLDQGKWSFGVLNDKVTDEVPGSILLLPNASRNEPLGLQFAPARTSASSLPSPFPPRTKSSNLEEHGRRRPPAKKRTPDGGIVLEPQPEDTLNDPLNWPAWRRDVALLSLGFYCMIGGGMTPILAAGFQNVAQTYHVTIPQVALTTGLYMLGLGIGSVLFSPTGIIWGKRPVYLFGILLFLLSAIWCALSPSYVSLVIARIFMGLAVSPCECLPSATIAEIFYLHERAYRLGIYTLLLLSGKNLLPLVSAAIIQGLDWRWVFWIIAIIVGFCFLLMFFFVPETFWNRVPHGHHIANEDQVNWSKLLRTRSGRQHQPEEPNEKSGELGASAMDQENTSNGNDRPNVAHHVCFATQSDMETERDHTGLSEAQSLPPDEKSGSLSDLNRDVHDKATDPTEETANSPSQVRQTTAQREPKDDRTLETEGSESQANAHEKTSLSQPEMEKDIEMAPITEKPGQPQQKDDYTNVLRSQPAKRYVQTLRPWNGTLRDERWHLVALRPFVLFAYPAILWSTLVYSLSIGWLIVLSESVSEIYKSADTYHFTSLQAGLVYISPFVGGVFGTAVAGKVSDIVVRWMTRRNEGIYEPEFRLVMAIPVTISTCIGLMGFGWSAQERDRWIVPTVFFGIISFGCSLGSTTSITFAVDSYRQYAGEALVTLNFSKNVLHGFIFSLFFNHWLEADGPKNTFIAIGCIQLICLLTTIPMYIYGKRARMWTVRRNLMERF